MNGIAVSLREGDRKSRMLLWALPGWCLLTAYGLTCLGSKNSFLYPMNDWVDVHCFFTVGRGILDGKMPYLDLFEQKGPLLYLLYALGALISRDSFLGVWLLEGLAVGAFLTVAAMTVRLLSGKDWAAFLSAPVLCGGMLLSPAFCHGGSAEELALVFLALPMYLFFRAEREQRALSGREGLLFGACAACCLWIKYTFLGLHLALGLWALCWTFRRGGLPALGRWLGMALLGAMCVTLPILCWFLARGALSSLWDVYFVQNLVTYSSSASNRHAGPWQSLLLNGWWTALFPLGVLYFLIRRRWREGLMWGLAFAGLFITTFIGGKTYPYYTLILVSLAAPGFGILELISLKSVPEGLKRALPCAAVCALAVFFTWKVHSDSPNAYLRAYEREEMPPYRFARIIRQTENASLLNEGFLDGGFYFASGTEPENRYFCTLNMDLPEMEQEHDTLIREGAVTYIVTRGKKQQSLPGYTLADTASFPFEGRDWTYQLWRLSDGSQPVSTNQDDHSRRRP